jgi:transcription initiation factor TFIIIB Brf1 subunit/transcription initiation factor TFIIB
MATPCCQDPKIVEDEGQGVCISCGTIGEGVIDSGAEWRYYGGDDRRDDPTRCGKPVNDLLPESSQISTISGGSGCSKEIRKMCQFVSWNSMPGRERSQYQVFEYIQHIGSVVGIPRAILEDAIWFYKKMADECNVRGSNRDGMIASSMYMACQKHKCPYTMKEIGEMFQFESSSISKGCKKASEILKDVEVDVKIEQPTPMVFVERICGKLSMDEKSIKLCQFAAFRWEKLGIEVVNNPNSIAASLVQVVIEKYGLPITKKSLSTASGISTVSIAKCRTKIAPHIELLLPGES